MKFLKKLKIAVINKDLETLEELSKLSPDVKSVEEANELLNYLIEAKKIIEKEKSKVNNEMKEIKKIKKFYSNEISKNNKFNFKI